MDLVILSPIYGLPFGSTVVQVSGSRWVIR